MKTQQGFTHAFLAIGIITVLVGALGFVLWKNFGSSTTSDISTWKTYENNELPITFKYPNGWTEVKQDKTGYVKLFGGSTNSVKGYSLGVFYGKGMANTLPVRADCSVNTEEINSCEEFKTEIMSGFIVASEVQGSDYEFNANIGEDRYTFNANNGYLDMNSFKELLTSVKLK